MKGDLFMTINQILDTNNFNEVVKKIQECKSIATSTIVIRNSDKYSNFIKENTKYIPEECSIYYRIMMIRYNIFNYEDLPRCKNCNCLLDDIYVRKYFQNNNSGFCSKKCYSEFPKSLETLDKISNRMKKQWAEKDEEYKKAFYEKVAATNIERYGTKCTLNTEENIKKKKETWILKYGVDNPTKSEEIKEKIKRTNNERYGGNSPLNNTDIQEKSKQTLLCNYNVTNPMNSSIIKAKIRLNSIEKYGVDWVSKSDEAWKKYCATVDSSNFIRPKYKKYKIYTYKSGKEIIVQGYEDVALDFYILLNYDEDDIENRITFMNSLNIKYVREDNSIHKYIPDFYIKSKNLIIEVKSQFTFYTDLFNIENKCKSSIENGYDIIVIVFETVNIKNLNIKYKIYNYEDIKAERKKYCD